MDTSVNVYFTFCTTALNLIYQYLSEYFGMFFIYLFVLDRAKDSYDETEVIAAGVTRTFDIRAFKFKHTIKKKLW